MATDLFPQASSTARSDDLPPLDVFYGRSDSMLDLRKNVERVADSDAPILILGESGTGKQLLAKLIHEQSHWRQGSFIKINCPAIPATLLESELFGYEKGAFTGAAASKPGRVELAETGTLFLDEIGELPPGLQAKLLHFLQDGVFCRIGGQVETRTQARVICATNRHLEEEVRAGRFRRDLYFRINVVSLQLLPLRERLCDIPDLANYFLFRYQQKFNRRVPPLSGKLFHLMQNYSWPGNIRQLENLMSRCVILGPEETLTHELPSVNEDHPTWGLPPAPADGSVPLKQLSRQAVQELEKKVILGALEANGWSRKRTARALNISYRTLIYKIRHAGLRPGKKRTGDHAVPSG